MTSTPGASNPAAPASVPAFDPAVTLTKADVARLVSVLLEVKAQNAAILTHLEQAAPLVSAARERFMDPKTGKVKFSIF